MSVTRALDKLAPATRALDKLAPATRALDKLAPAIRASGRVTTLTMAAPRHVDRVRPDRVPTDPDTGAPGAVVPVRVRGALD